MESFQNGGAAGAVGAGDISAFVRLTEVKFDPPGIDGAYEFVELQGESLTGVGRRWLVALEGDLDANPGRIDVAIDLSRCAASPCHFDERGLLLLVTNQTLLPSASSVSRESLELANGALENGTTSLLVLDAPSDLEPGTADWDVDDDGVLELPDGWRILDSVSWIDSASDRGYGSILLGPKPKPHAVWRCRDASGGDRWGYGQLIGDSGSVTVDPGNCILAGLVGSALSPGAPNPCSEPGLPTTVGAPAAVTSDSGQQALSGVPTVYAQASAGVPTRAAIGGGAATVPSSISLGGRSSAAVVVPAVSQAGAESVRVVDAAARTDQAGTSGWWSPNPFASSLAHAAETGVGGAPVIAPSRNSGGAPTPAMPSGCEAAPASVRRPVPWVLLGLALALAPRQRWKRISPAPYRQRRASGLGELADALHRAGHSAIRAPKMSNRAIWNVRRRHEWLTKPIKGKRLKKRSRMRVGLQAAIDRRQAPVAPPAEA